MSTNSPNAKKLKEKLTELGLYEIGMDVKDMSDLMAAIHNSCDSAEQEEIERASKKFDTSMASDSTEVAIKKGLERRYANVPERRLPWNLFPIPAQLTMEQRVHVMAAYKEQLSICRYRRAKTSSVFSDWNCVFSIPISKHRAISEFRSGAIHTRSGRTLKTAPHYTDDDSDTEIWLSRKSRKRIRKIADEDCYIKANSSQDYPIQSQANCDPLIETKKKSIEAKNDSNSSGKIHLDNAVSEDDIEYIQNGRKNWRSESTEPSTSKMMVYAQVHQQCPDSIRAENNEEHNKKTICNITRSRPKRLKLPLDE